MLSIHLYPPDRRIRDLDNSLKPLLDVLEHGGVLENDRQVVGLTATRHPFGSDGVIGQALVFVFTAQWTGPGTVEPTDG